MSDDRGSRATLLGWRTLLGLGWRALLDAIVVGLWVVFLVLAFLATGWPAWAFYVALFGGVAVYVALTASL